jgi:hypothetical protein
MFAQITFQIDYSCRNINLQMLAMVNNSNCVQFLVRAHLCKSGILEEASLKVLVMNKAKVKNSEDWREMKKNYPQLAMDVLEKLM